MHKSAVYPGLLILLSAVSALLVCNLGYSNWYNEFFAQYLTVGVGGFQVKKGLLPLINEGLMALFFLAVTIEIRYEFSHGSLKERRHVMLPLCAAIGGMLVPALIYAYLNWGGESLVGWAIPTATDIAFSLACLMLLSKSLPESLRAFLLSLAVIDDLGAILIIALYYSDHLSYVMMAGGMFVVSVMLLLRYMRVRSYKVYLGLGLLLWGFMLKSGVHATLSGCVIAILLPMENMGEDIMKLYHRLLPWVQYLILPVFAFANTGVELTQDVQYIHPVFLGIVLGLFVGKPLGVVLFSYIAEKLGIALRPLGVNYHHILGVGFLCGIGFTMSLFVGMLAFDEEMVPLMGTVRAAILSASLIAGIVGTSYLAIVGSKDE